MKKAVVIGAGITGLRIAEILSNNNYQVDIIEKTSKVGGMTASFKYKDFILDYGPHKFYTQLPGIYDDFKKIVGEGDYLVVKKKNSIRLLGKYFDFPVKMGQLLTRIPPTTAAKIFLDFTKSQLSSKKPVNYEDYFVKGFGRTGYNLVFKGFAEKVWGDPKTLSEELARRRSPAGSIFDVLKTMIKKSDQNVSAESFYYPKHGYGVMCDNMAKTIIKNKGSIILNSTVDKIDVKDKDVKSLSITTKVGEKKVKKNIKCDVLISTISITDIPQLIYDGQKLDEIKEYLTNLKYRSLIISFVFLKKERALKDNWLFFPEREFIFNRVAEQKSFSEYTTPKDKTVLTAEITCNHDDKLYAEDDSKIKELVVADLEKAGLIKKEEVYDFFTRKAGKVYPVYSLNYKDSLTKLTKELNSINNLYTVGRLGLFNYNNADHCLDMANVTAKIIIEDSKAAKWEKAIDYFNNYRIVD